MLSNRKTVVALTAACLFALNDAAKLDQCCNDGGDDTENLMTGVSDTLVEEIARVTAELKALKDDFIIYKEQAAHDLEVIQLPDPGLDEFKQMTQAQLDSLQQSQDLASQAQNELTTSMISQFDELRVATNENADVLQTLNNEHKDAVQLMRGNAETVAFLKGEEERISEELRGVAFSVSNIESSQITWDGFYTNEETFECTLHEWKTLAMFSSIANETLDCHATISTDWQGVSYWLALGMFQDGVEKAYSIDDSSSPEQWVASDRDDNGVVTLLYKAKPTQDTNWEVKVHGGDHGCVIPWAQAQVSCKTYGATHELTIYQD